MLTQLAELTREADGRYAHPTELQFLQDYLASVEVRISAYQKIRNNAREIIENLEVKMRENNPELLRNGGKDVSKIWRRDSTNLLRYSAAALLFNEVEHLRDGMLLWHKTIAKSFKFERHGQATLELLQEVIPQFLTDAEAKLFCRILQMDSVLLF